MSLMFDHIFNLIFKLFLDTILLKTFVTYFKYVSTIK